MSIFARCESSENGEPEFWVEDRCPVVGHRGILIEIKKNNAVEFKNNYSLNKSILTKYCKNHHKSVNLDYCILIKIEVNQIEAYKPGFTIQKGGVSRMFFAENNEDYLVWIKELSKVAALTDIENDYTIMFQLESSSLSSFHLGNDIFFQKNYGIKRFEKQRLDQISIIGILDEIRILRQLEYHHFNKLHHVYESETHLFMVFEYEVAESLFEKLSKRRHLDLNESLKIVTQILDCLNYLNLKNIVHRDLKLENIFLQDDHVRILDFGLACQTQDNLTQICGSPGYIAPEILRRTPYNHKCDVFSVGVIFYSLLSGKLPFSGRNQREILVKNREANIVYKKDFWESFPGEVLSLVVRMTDSNPLNRISIVDAIEIIKTIQIDQTRDWISPN